MYVSFIKKTEIHVEVKGQSSLQCCFHAFIDWYPLFLPAGLAFEMALSTNHGHKSWSYLKKNIPRKSNNYM